MAATLSFVVPTAAPFDLWEMVHAYGAVQLPPWAWDEEARVLRRAERFSKGVGRASAAYLLHMLGRYDEVYVDTAVLGFLSRHVFDGRRPREKEARDAFVQYDE